MSISSKPTSGVKSGDKKSKARKSSAKSKPNKKSKSKKSKSKSKKSVSHDAKSRKGSKKSKTSMKTHHKESTNKSAHKGLKKAASKSLSKSTNIFQLSASIIGRSKNEKLKSNFTATDSNVLGRPKLSKHMKKAFNAKGANKVESVEEMKKLGYEVGEQYHSLSNFRLGHCFGGSEKNKSVVKLIDTTECTERYKVTLEKHSIKICRFIGEILTEICPKIFDIFFCKSVYYFFMPEYPTNTLYDVVMQGIVVPEKQIQKWLQQLVTTVIELQKNGIAHRFMKIKHLLHDRSTDNITMVGWSKSVFFYDCEKKKQLLQHKERRARKNNFLPPESFNLTYDPSKADVWSIGVILVALVTHRYPFHVRSDIKFTKQWRMFVRNHPMNPIVRAACNKIFCADPSTRIKARDLIKDQFFKVEPELLVNKTTRREKNSDASVNHDGVPSEELSIDAKSRTKSKSKSKKSESMQKSNKTSGKKSKSHVSSQHSANKSKSKSGKETNEEANEEQNSKSKSKSKTEAPEAPENEVNGEESGSKVQSSSKAKSQAGSQVLISLKPKSQGGSQVLISQKTKSQAGSQVLTSQGGSQKAKSQAGSQALTSQEAKSQGGSQASMSQKAKSQAGSQALTSEEAKNQTGSQASMSQKAKSQAGSQASMSQKAKSQAGSQASMSQKAKSQGGSQASMSQKANSQAGSQVLTSQKGSQAGSQIPASQEKLNNSMNEQLGGNSQNMSMKSKALSMTGEKSNLDGMSKSKMLKSNAEAKEGSQINANEGKSANNLSKHSSVMLSKAEQAAEKEDEAAEKEQEAAEMKEPEMPKNNGKDDDDGKDEDNTKADMNAPEEKADAGNVVEQEPEPQVKEIIQNEEPAMEQSKEESKIGKKLPN